MLKHLILISIMSRDKFGSTKNRKQQLAIDNLLHYLASELPSLRFTSNNIWDAQGYKISNVEAPSELKDVVTLEYFQLHIKKLINDRKKSNN